MKHTYQPSHFKFRPFTQTCLSLLLVLILVDLPLGRTSALAQETVDGASPKPFGAGIDYGEPIDPEPPEKEKKSIWPWVIGVGAAVVAGVVAFLAVDSADDDAAKSADKAEAAAAEASAVTAAAMAKEAMEMAVETAVAEAVAATAGAATEGAAGAAAKLTQKIIIAGVFMAPSTPCELGSTNTVVPSITFTPIQSGVLGGIPFHRPIDCSKSESTAPGNYEQVNDTTLVILTNDGFYNGTATVVQGNRLRVGNGTTFLATAGASINFVPVAE